MPTDRRATDVKTTVWIPRDVSRRLKMLAAERGTSVRLLLVDALRSFLDRTEGRR